MASQSLPILTYHAQQFRVRVEISREQALTLSEPPADLVKRAKSKLESLKKEGKIINFDVYETKLTNIWEGLKKATHLPSSHTVSFTLAAGAPQLQGLKIERNPSDANHVTVTLAADAPMKSWNREWIKATIVRVAKDLGMTQSLSMSEIQACITRILLGEHVTNYKIPLQQTAAPVAPTASADKPYSIVANKTRGDVAVIINQLNVFIDEKVINQVVADVLLGIEVLKKSVGGQYKFHKQDLVECIRGAFKGPESVGVGMPMTILAVTGSGQIQKLIGKVQSVPGASGHADASAPQSNTPKHLSFKISDDRMKAHITGFSDNIYHNASITFNREWFEGQLKLSGIVSGLHDDIWAKIEETWAARKTLDHLLAAQGTESVAGKEPYLHLVYKDAPGTSSDGKVVNLRESQQRTLVTAGQLVAEIRFKVPNTIGKTVTGQSLQPPKPDLAVTVGDGINQKEPGKYYATTDGLPQCQETSISVVKVYVHEGDVDLKSGNIRFDGPVEIKGSIDTGATVDVKGPLIVHGMIRGALVKCKDSIEVKEGIVTTETGRIQCKGDIKAEFIENSRIQCGGSVTANKAILNSQVFAAKNIILTSNEGIVGGGLLSCRDALVSNNVGFPSGAQTILILGADVRTMQRVALRTGRVQKLKEAGERYKAELREIAGKRQAQVTLKLKERKEKLTEMSAKLKELLEKAELLVTIAQGKIVYNNGALLVCYKRLALNCAIEIAGHTVPLTTEMLSVAVSGRKRKDTHLCTAEEVAQELERILASSAPSSASNSEQKAS